MTKSCLDVILIGLAALALIGLAAIFGFTPLGRILGTAACFFVLFIDCYISLGMEKIREKKQKVVICPRCMILVD